MHEIKISQQDCKDSMGESKTKDSFSDDERSCEKKVEEMNRLEIIRELQKRTHWSMFKSIIKRDTHELRDILYGLIKHNEMIVQRIKIYER